MALDTSPEAKKERYLQLAASAAARLITDSYNKGFALGEDQGYRTATTSKIRDLMGCGGQGLVLFGYPVDDWLAAHGQLVEAHGEDLNPRTLVESLVESQVDRSGYWRDEAEKARSRLTTAMAQLREQSLTLEKIRGHVEEGVRA